MSHAWIFAAASFILMSCDSGVIFQNPNEMAPSLHGEVIDHSINSENLCTVLESESFKKWIRNPPPSETNAQLQASLLLFHKTNEVRRRLGLPKFQWSGSLALASFQHSCEMCKLNYFSHFSTVKGFELHSDRWKWAKQELGLSLRAGFISENIFWAQRWELEPEELIANLTVEKWMKSPGHKQNIISLEAKFSGSALIYCSRSEDFIEWYATMNYRSGDPE